MPSESSALAPSLVEDWVGLCGDFADLGDLMGYCWVASKKDSSSGSMTRAPCGARPGEDGLSDDVERGEAMSTGLRSGADTDTFDISFSTHPLYLSARSAARRRRRRTREKATHSTSTHTTQPHTMPMSAPVDRELDSSSSSSPPPLPEPLAPPGCTSCLPSGSLSSESERGTDENGMRSAGSTVTLLVSLAESKPAQADASPS
mmetsp:Transcript_5297/g.17053  ORF Transcript_5297/g.17053 Transcript_5297/m.17053 type:complete len:204 (+) Transcript_5297:39-650(+)